MKDQFIESVWNKAEEGNTDFIEHQFRGAYQIYRFLLQVFGDEGLGAIAIRAGENQMTCEYDDELITTISLDCALLAKKVDVLFRIGLHRYDCLCKNNNYDRLEEIITIPCLWVNIKIQNPSTIPGQLPSLADAVEFLKSQDIKPDIIVNAGTELQAYWIFEKPFIIDSAAANDEITELSYDFQQKIIAAGLQRGWLIDDTSNIDRYQRLPGTWNWEHNPPTQINILEPENNDWIFTGKH